MQNRDTLSYMGAAAKKYNWLWLKFLMYVYALKLQGNRFYVGKTKAPHRRIVEEHIKGKSNAWVKTYPPVEVVELFSESNKFDELFLTLKYMDKYGLENVRGAAFVSFVLDNNTKVVLRHMLRGSNDRCLKCGSAKHFADNCPGIAPASSEDLKSVIAFADQTSKHDKQLYHRHTSASSSSESGSPIQAENIRRQQRNHFDDTTKI